MTVARARACAHHTNAVQEGGEGGQTHYAPPLRARACAHTSHKQVVSAHTDARACVGRSGQVTHTTLHTRCSVSPRRCYFKRRRRPRGHAPPPPPHSKESVQTARPAQRERANRAATQSWPLLVMVVREGAVIKNKVSAGVQCVLCKRACRPPRRPPVRRLFEECGCCCGVRDLCV